MKIDKFKTMSHFVTYNTDLNPRTIGVIIEDSECQDLMSLNIHYRTGLDLWLKNATAWGKLAVFSRLDTRDQSAEVAVYQDGQTSALQPCGNAALAAAARLLGTKPSLQLVVSEPRSGYRYLCRCSQAGNGCIIVDGCVEFQLGSYELVNSNASLKTFRIDNYNIHVWADSSSIPLFPSEELLGSMKVIHVDAPRQITEFFNLHGKHGAVPITGYVILSRLVELGALSESQLPEAWLGNLRAERTEPGLRALRLPTRIVRFMETS